MVTQPGKIQRIKLESLLIDLQNPRYDPRSSQREALETIANEQGNKLVNLAEDILDKGLNPSKLPIVTPADDDSELFVVLEGNRRVAALKLLTSKESLKSLQLPSRLVERIGELQNEAQASSISSQIDCVVLSREDAKHWIQLEHTGENEGVGVLSWDGLARHRFRESSPALQAVDLVEKSAYLDAETRARLPKIAITNIERLLVTPEARSLLGVDVKGGQLIISAPEDQTVRRLAIVVSDVAHRSIRVTDLDTKEQRVSYANQVATRPPPTPQTTKASELTLKRPRPVIPRRSTLVPRHLTLTIRQTRINQIFHELKSLNIDKYTNSCAVLFRVFMEMSVDDFAQRNNVSLKDAKTGKEMILRKKLQAVSDFLAKKGVDKPELQGIKTITSNRNHVLSIDSWHAYVHNKDYNPTPTELKSNWDSTQSFIQRIWEP